jgi:hypothetical protein
MVKCADCGCEIHLAVLEGKYCYQCYDNHKPKEYKILNFLKDNISLEDNINLNDEQRKMRTVRWISAIVFVIAVLAIKNTGSSESIFIAFIAFMGIINNISLSALYND